MIFADCLTLRIPRTLCNKANRSGTEDHYRNRWFFDRISPWRAALPTRSAIDASLIIHIRSPMHLHLPLSRLRTPAIDPSIPESKQRHKGPSYPTFYSVSSDPVVITPEALLRGRPSRLDTPGTMSSRDERGEKISGRLWGSWQLPFAATEPCDSLSKTSGGGGMARGLGCAGREETLRG